MAALECTTRFLFHRQFLQPWISLTTSVRWRTRKPNVQRPIPDHYMKAKYKNALKPIYPDPLTNKPWFEVCGNLFQPEKTSELSKYQELLSKEFFSKFANAQLIGIFQENPTKSYEKLKLKGMFHGHGIKMAYGSKAIVTHALSGTEFEPVLKLHMSNTCYMCMDQLRIDKLLKFSKKMPTFVLLGGVVQGRTVTKSQLVWCSTLPDIEVLQAELCSILSSASSHLSQSLVYHQQTLSKSLQMHVGASEDQSGNTSSS